MWTLVWKILKKTEDRWSASILGPIPKEFQSHKAQKYLYALTCCCDVLRFLDKVYYLSARHSHFPLTFWRVKFFYSFCSIKNTSKNRFILIYVYVHLCIHVWVLMEAARGSQISWSWFLMWLQAAKHGHREPNLYTWEEQQAPLTAEASLQCLNHF